MKKTITIIGLILTFLIIYFLQANFFSWFTIAGIKPNLFIILVLFISLFVGMKYGIVFALIFGLFLDIVIGKTIEINTIMLTVVAILGGYFDKNFSKDSKITIMLMVIGSTLIFEIGSYVLSIIMLNTNIEILSFARIILIEVLYNAILTVILYPLIQNVGYKIEDIYKGQKILTRYF